MGHAMDRSLCLAERWGLCIQVHGTLKAFARKWRRWNNKIQKFNSCYVPVAINICHQIFANNSVDLFILFVKWPVC